MKHIRWHALIIVQIYNHYFKIHQLADPTYTPKTKSSFANQNHTRAERYQTNIMATRAASFALYYILLLTLCSSSFLASVQLQFILTFAYQLNYYHCSIYVKRGQRFEALLQVLHLIVAETSQAARANVMILNVGHRAMINISGFPTSLMQVAFAKLPHVAFVRQIVSEILKSACADGAF